MNIQKIHTVGYEVYPYTTQLTKIDSRWIQVLNIKTKTIKIVKKKSTGYIYDLGVKKGLLK